MEILRVLGTVILTTLAGIVVGTLIGWIIPELMFRIEHKRKYDAWCKWADSLEERSRERSEEMCKIFEELKRKEYEERNED